MTTLTKQLQSGKFNGKVYADGSIYINGEKIVNPDLNELLDYAISSYIPLLKDFQIERYNTLTKSIDRTYLSAKSFELYSQIIGMCFNFAKGRIEESAYLDKIHPAFERGLKFYRISK